MRSLCLATLFASTACLMAQDNLEQIHIDLSDARKNVIHSEIIFPVNPGPLTLVYPKWIPGNHAPTGPIGNVAGLVMSAQGKSLDWRRDPLDPYTFHIQIPAGTTSLQVRFDFLAVGTPDVGPIPSVATTEKLAVLRWPLVVLYPAGVQFDAWNVEASITLPDGWKYGTALEGATQVGQTVHFTPVTLEKLVDSPVIAGEYFRRFRIAAQMQPVHFMNIVADAPKDLVTTPDQELAMTNLVREAYALFQSHHFNHYDFLVSLSGKFRTRTALGGLEHHESSDDTGSENVFRSSAGRETVGEGLSHEYAHSWNGKYRRPVGENTTDYQTPLDTRLSWVYEGLTTYLGHVLSVRSGATTPEEFRDSLSGLAADMESRSGRQWRDLEDVSMSLPALMNTSHGWSNWRRSIDYYSEGALIWLEVDVKIRSLTHNGKNLDDFCRTFFGNGKDTPPAIVPYSFDQLTEALNQVAPFNWAALLTDRLHSKSAHAPLNGIDQAGWRLAYAASPNAVMQPVQQEGGGLNAIYSIGLELAKDGTITDVRWGSAADEVGIGPGMRLMSIEGAPYSSQIMRDAMKHAGQRHGKLSVIVMNTGYSRSLEIDCPVGEQYPYLQRVKGQPDILGAIAKPIAH